MVYSVANQRKHQSSASLAFVWGIYQWFVNSPHKGPVMQKMFPLDDVTMYIYIWYETFIIILCRPDWLWLFSIESQLRNGHPYALNLYFSLMHLINEAWTKWVIFCRQLLQMLFLNKNFKKIIEIAPNVVPKCTIDKKSPLVQVMTWHWTHATNNNLHQWWLSLLMHTVEPLYNTIVFHQNTHKRHPIARP